MDLHLKEYPVTVALKIIDLMSGDERVNTIEPENFNHLASYDIFLAYMTGPSISELNISQFNPC
jgi:hypothetical protein